MFSLQTDSHLLAAFRQGLREFVGLEERNIALEVRSAEGNPERLPGLVAELVRLKADVIVDDTTDAIRAAMRETSTVPIVMAIAADPWIPVEQPIKFELVLNVRPPRRSA